MSLSEKILIDANGIKVIIRDDVKEAARLLKENFCYCHMGIELNFKGECKACKDINKVFGEKLI